MGHTKPAPLGYSSHRMSSVSIAGVSVSAQPNISTCTHIDLSRRISSKAAFAASDARPLGLVLYGEYILLILNVFITVRIEC